MKNDREGKRERESERETQVGDRKTRLHGAISIYLKGIIITTIENRQKYKLTKKTPFFMSV